MDDFISLTTTKPDTQECDVLQLSPEEAPLEELDVKELNTPPKPRPDNFVKQFYPRCKRVLTRPPFRKQTNPISSSVTPAVSNGDTMPTPTNDTITPTNAKKVWDISLEKLMSIEEVKPPERKRQSSSADERVGRLRAMLKQSETEKATLQGYVTSLQAKLSAVPKKGPVKVAHSQTDEYGVKCPTCKSSVEPQILAKSFGEDFSYNAEKQKFVQKSTGFYYHPNTQLYESPETGIVYYWDSSHNIYHYHSKTQDNIPDNISDNISEEEGELKDPAQTTIDEELTDAANKAMNEKGIRFIESLNMYFDKNTGLYYCQSSGLYYDTKMCVFYTLKDSVYQYHSTAKPDETNSAYAKTSIRAIVKETGCHKVNAGTLFVFTCMGGTIGREGSHVATLPEIRVSKRHATVSYCSGKYYIIDEGTMNGTFLNNTRLSIQKEVSDRFELSHLDEVKIGSTVLQLHIHNNNDTCNWCEPGLTSQPPSATISEPPTLYKQRTKEVNRLKRKYKLLGNN